MKRQSDLRSDFWQVWANLENQNSDLEQIFLPQGSDFLQIGRFWQGGQNSVERAVFFFASNSFARASHFGEGLEFSRSDLNVKRLGYW